MSIVLMADDDVDDCMLAKEAFGEAAGNDNLHCVEDGIKLMDHLLNTSRLPSLILLDLNMPRKDGRQALREIKSIRSLQHIPIVIFTTSQDEKDIVFSREMGADSFITKPARFQEWVDIMKMLIQKHFQRNGGAGIRPDSQLILFYWGTGV
ncbi:MAG: response regulator [Desulfobacteraceae bacterium]|nr:MAG: response regulator [Desulfobacteraceae bacterium]